MGMRGEEVARAPLPVTRYGGVLLELGLATVAVLAYLAVGHLTVDSTGQAVAMRQTARPTRAAMEKLQASSQYLLQHIHEAPAMLIPCIEDRVEGESVVEQANAWGSILPATWSFMLAARLHGLGTCWTTLHLYYEREAATVLGIPYEQVMQTALIPIAYTRGTDFRPARRHSLEHVVHWERW